MARKTTGKAGATGKGGRREGGPKAGAKRGSGKPGGSQGGAKRGPGKPGAKGPKRPGWLPEPPPRGGMRPPAHGGGGDPFAAREAARYEQPIASRELITETLAGNDGPMDADALAERLGLAAPDRFEALSKRLSAMLRDGQLLQNRKGEYAPAERMDLIAGSVIANPDGFGFLRPDSGAGDDLFLLARLGDSAPADPRSDHLDAMAAKLGPPGARVVRPVPRECPATPPAYNPFAWRVASTYSAIPRSSAPAWRRWRSRCSPPSGSPGPTTRSGWRSR